MTHLNPPCTLPPMTDVSAPAPQVEVTNIEAPPEPEGDVLAEAAVASAAVSGAAAATALDAREDAAQAQATAEQANANAQAAASMAATGITAEEAERIADERVDKLVLALQATQAPAAPTPAPEAEPAPAKDEAPKSVKKVKRKTTFRDRYLGIERE